MEKLQFELTNQQRKYLGLIPVEKHWELVKLNEMYLYFDGDIIRKKITVEDNGYLEQELAEKTAENRTILLPKTAKGKPKKLNFTATQSFSPFGVYFGFNDGYVTISNYTTQTTYFSESSDKIKNHNDIKAWLDKWIVESTETDLKEIEAFKTAERKHQKFKEGDFFAFKIGRRNWGFGRILIDVAALNKSDEFKKQKNYGLSQFMGKALIVKIYHKISDSLNVDFEALSNTMALPSQAVMDNHFYYGEKIIIGHKPLSMAEYDMLISYGKSISSDDKRTVYLQYGFIYKETDISNFSKYLTQTRYDYDEDNPYRNESIGFDINTDNLEQCIKEKSNQSFWNADDYTLEHDLRNPANIEIKREIFSFFGLDADKSYEENLKMIG